MAIVYKFVAGEAFKPIAERLVALGYPEPNVMLSVGWMAEDEDSGEIVGVMVLQGVALAGPPHVEEGHRHNGVGVELMRRCEEHIKTGPYKRVLMHTSNPGVAHLIEAMGAVKHEDELFEWRR